MSSQPQAHPETLDRRRFLRGGWTGQKTAAAGPGDAVEVAGILVLTYPADLDAVAAGILAMGCTEIHSRDPAGKLVVVAETPTTGALGDLLHRIALTPKVLCANLAFHATDAASA